MQNTALHIATVCTRDFNIQHLQDKEIIQPLLILLEFHTLTINTVREPRT